MYSIRNKSALFAPIVFAFLSPVYGVASPLQEQTQKPDEPTKIPDAKSRPQRIRVGGNVQAAKIITRIQPQYPENAKEQRISGTLRLHVVVGTNGSVQEVTPISGDLTLADAAVEAVRQWKYEVATLNKVPVEVDTVVDIIFSLRS